MATKLEAQRSTSRILCLSAAHYRELFTKTICVLMAHCPEAASSIISDACPEGMDGLDEIIDDCLDQFDLQDRFLNHSQHLLMIQN